MGVFSDRLTHNSSNNISTCKTAKIPLIVINDPRASWSSSPPSPRSYDEELYESAKKTRARVKGDIVKKALRVKEGSAYERGKEEGQGKEERRGRMQRRSDEKRWERKVEEKERIIRELRERLSGATGATNESEGQATTETTNNQGNPQSN